MVRAPFLPDEDARLATLFRYRVLDTTAEPTFDDIAQVAAAMCGTAMAAISLVDEHRQWFKARVGFDATESPRDLAICAHAIAGTDLLVVPDTREDPRFSDNPAVMAAGIRFYAGAPLIASEGHVLGTVCVFDTVPRDLGPAARRMLVQLARDVVRHLELRRGLFELDARVHGRAPDQVIQGRIERAQATLHATERRFHARLEHTRDAVALLGADGLIIHASDSNRAILGRDPSWLVGKNAFELIHPDDHEFVKSRLMVCLQRPAAQVDVFARVRHADGTWRDLEGVFTNLLHDDSVRAIVINYRDQSERRRLEDELQASRRLEAVGRLAGGVAHDFNNILTAILGHLELVRRRTSEDPRVMLSLDEIEQGARRAAALTQQLLAVGRRQILRPQRVDINAQLEQLAPMIGSAVGARSRVILRLAPGLGPARVDPTQLEQVVLQLALNARDVMPDGGALTVETGALEVSDPEAQLPAGAWIRLTIADTGPGLSPEEQARLFEPFFTAAEAGGTSFGLAAVLGMVRQGGGHLTVESRPGVGTSFHIFLPAATEADQARPAVAPASTPRPVTTGERQRLLLVDDEPTLRRILGRVLGREGYHVVEAESVGAALSQLRNHDGFDGILCDVRLPDGDGFELARAAATLAPGARVLLMSGYSGAAALADGAPPLLLKPFTPDELLSAVGRLLER